MRGAHAGRDGGRGKQKGMALRRAVKNLGSERGEARRGGLAGSGRRPWTLVLVVPLPRAMAGRASGLPACRDSKSKRASHMVWRRVTCVPAIPPALAGRSLLGVRVPVGTRNFSPPVGGQRFCDINRVA